MRSTSKVVETVWIFEKETSKIFDDTPIYEGVIIEYLHRVEVSHTQYVYSYNCVTTCICSSSDVSNKQLSSM